MLVSNMRSSVDFLTVTTKVKDAGIDLLDALYKALPSDFLRDVSGRKWHFQGYHGHAYNGVRYGMRGDEAIVMLSGGHASALYARVAPKRAKCTRIDLAVTVLLERPDTGLVDRCYSGAVEESGPNLAMIHNSKGGSTLYVGSRTSRYFGRLYDKGAEQGGEPGTLWRWEVEAKKPAAESVLAQLLLKEKPTLFIAGFVCDWFMTRGIVTPIASTDGESAIEIEATVDSREKKLNWLSSQVRPTVGRLIVEGGSVDVLEALGLPNYVENTNLKRGGSN